MCLGKRGLGKFWYQEQGKNLRVSAALQWACLQNASMPGYPDHKTVCERWVECLKGSDKFERLKDILRARGAEKAPLPAQLSPTPTVSPTATPTVTPSWVWGPRRQALPGWRSRSRNYGSRRKSGALITDVQRVTGCTILPCISVYPLNLSFLLCEIYWALWV